MPNDPKDASATTWQNRLGRIPADHYWREDVLARELEAVFKPSWLCVGFVDDLMLIPVQSI